MSFPVFDRGRRKFILGTGGVAVALPFLRMFGQNVAEAQSGARPTRLVVVMNPQGLEAPQFVPSATGTSYDVTPVLQPLAAYLDRVTVLSGIDNKARRSVFAANGHNAAARTLFTAMPFASMMNGDGTVYSQAQQGGAAEHSGRSWGPSFDQVLAAHLRGQTPLDSLALRVGGPGVGEYELFFSGTEGATSPVPADHDPAVAFARVAGFVDTSSSGGTNDMASRLRGRRGAILGSVAPALARLRKQAPSEDRETLERHEAYLESLSERYARGASGGGSGCGLVTLGGGYDPAVHGNDYRTAPDHIENVVMALACDVTRVATIQFTQYHRPTFPWLNQSIPGSWSTWHDLIHANATNDQSKRLAVKTWYATQVASLLGRLAETPDGAGSLLDNTLVVWMTEFSSAATHLTNGIPTVIAGGGGGHRGGQHLSVAGRNTGDLFATLLTMCGRPTERFGLARSHTGETLSQGLISGLT
jgi:hypothetical protein